MVVRKILAEAATAVKSGDGAKLEQLIQELKQEAADVQERQQALDAEMAEIKDAAKKISMAKQEMAALAERLFREVFAVEDAEEVIVDEDSDGQVESRELSVGVDTTGDGVEDSRITVVDTDGDEEPDMLVASTTREEEVVEVEDMEVVELTEETEDEESDMDDIEPEGEVTIETLILDKQNIEDAMEDEDENELGESLDIGDLLEDDI